MGSSLGLIEIGEELLFGLSQLGVYEEDEERYILGVAIEGVEFEEEL